MKKNEMFRIVSDAYSGWLGSHIKMRHQTKSGVIIFPNHGNSEVGKGLEMKLLKQAGLRK